MCAILRYGCSDSSPLSSHVKPCHLDTLKTVYVCMSKPVPIKTGQHLDGECRLQVLRRSECSLIKSDIKNDRGIANKALHILTGKIPPVLAELGVKEMQEHLLGTTPCDRTCWHICCSL